MNENLKHLFKEEANELLTELENVLLKLEQEPENNELVDRAFRALHTLKGAGGMFGFTDISMFVHSMESVYDKIRDRTLKINLDIIRYTLRALDIINYMLEIPEEKQTQEIADAIYEITTKFKSFTLLEELPKSETKITVVQKEKVQKKHTYKIIFKPENYLMIYGHNILALIKEIQNLGNTIVTTKFKELPPYNEFNPELLYTDWIIILSTDVIIDTIKDIFIFVESDAKIMVKKLCDYDIFENSITVEKIKFYLQNNEDIDGKIIETLENEIETAISSNSQIKNEILGRAKETTKEKISEQKVSSIRVPAEKLDQLVNLVGEMVTLQARLNQISLTLNNGDLQMLSEEVERLTWDLRDIALNIRMLPIGSTFSRFKRLVFDLSKELNKEIELITEGEETELDKTVIEKLTDPLMHIIRNSLDHGIETPEERIKLGKPSKGTIKLIAKQVGNEVIIEIIDDGKGLDKNKILNKAIEKGLVQPNVELTDTEIYQLVFLPGFSTAEKVTNLSGRGVGMDVVKTFIESLRGSVILESEQGKGTKVIIKLPLTLAIIDGLLVKVYEHIFVLPLSNVEECIELTKKEIEASKGRNIVTIRDEIVPYIRLSDFLNYQYPKLEIEQIVVLRIGDNRVGFCVDYVIGEHQTVIKTLPKIYKNLEGISGATILGDGTIALILDINKIYQLAEKEEMDEIEKYSNLIENWR
jgi:two-component system chemotaxis sensor kinase CheA